ncbi:hypothetical protein LQ327_09240 [Actinomycetospora endophytica]|uniref:Type III secretion system (T3SS) SseB-like protein n=1 Tax=Actinomycetospora endophytica TaxID=2291215 RepID=A0ABS8P5P5_9PSEU|nr:hypothetical protein [Actinomycetospora endophytica]MCD2193566.1 hypothetical protein [Actinomycetospora endophytica]
MGQMSFYSADALPRAITDLEGVLCAGGVMTLFGRGTAARLAIVLGAPPLLIEVPDDEVPDDEVPDDEAPVPVPDEPIRDQQDLVAAGGLAAEPWRPDDQQASVAVQEPAGDPPGTGDHGREWDEGVDEIPADEFPTRDEDPRPPDGAPPDDAPSDGARGSFVRIDRPKGPLAQNDDAQNDDAQNEDGPPDAPTPGVVTPDPVVEWRAHALCCALRGRGVPADVERLPDGRPVVRSAYRADLVGLATAWRGEDGATTVPRDLELDGPRLRLWVLAAGRRRGRAYTLGLDPHARATHEPLLTACQRAGLGATLAGDEDDPVVEIVGQRRQRRLAELVGDRPRSLVEGVWPE